MHGKWQLGPYPSVYAGKYVTEYMHKSAPN